MTASSQFTGPSFYVQNATQISGVVVRVRYSVDPLLVSNGGVNDALNKANYALTGPGSAIINDVNAAPEDPQSVDIVLASPLVEGVWAVAVANVTTTDGTALSAPTSAVFNAVATPVVTDPMVGATNIDEEEVLRRHFSPAFKGKGWDSIVAALATGDKTNNENAQTAFDQLFKCTASGVYLDRKCSEDGVRRPVGLGMSDDTFREYAIQTSTEKLTTKSIWETLEIFYGSDVVRGNATTLAYEPFDLDDGDTFSFEVDGVENVSVTFASSDFVSISAAKAIEVAAAITRACEKTSSKAYAVPFLDPEGGVTRVRIFSGSLGLKSSVRITGGEAQSVLQFPGRIQIQAPFAAITWTVTENIAAGTIRFATSSTVVFSEIQAGGVVTITEAASPLRGTYTISRVGSSYATGSWIYWFEVETDHQYNINPNPMTVAQSGADTFAFYYFAKNTVQTTGRGVNVSGTGTSVVSIPATSQVVTRSSGTAAYVQTADSLPVESMIGAHGLMVVETGPHSIKQGDHVFVDGAIAHPSPTHPDYTPDAYNPNTKVGTFPTNLMRGGLRVASLDGMQDCTRRKAAACYNNHTAYVFGGLNASGNIEVKCFAIKMFDPNSQSYSRVTIPNIDTRVMEAVAVAPYNSPNDLAVAVVHGMHLTNSVTNLVQVLKADASAWITKAISTARRGHQAVALSNGRIFVGPGRGAISAAVDESFTFVIDQNSEIYTEEDMFDVLRSRYDYAATAFGDGTKVLLCGGGVPGGDALKTCEVFEYGVGFRKTAPMLYARFKPASVLLPDGRVAVFGGSSSTLVGTNGSPTAEVWDPATEKWENLPPPFWMGYSPFAYWDSVAQCVVVVSSGTAGIHNAQAFDPVTGKWTSIHGDASMGLYYRAHCAGDGFGFAFGGGTLLQNASAQDCVSMIVPGEPTYSVANVNGMYKVSDVTENYIIVGSPNPGYCYCTGGTVTPVAAGEGVTPGPYLLERNTDPGIEGSFYATASAAGRTAAQETIENNAAAGLPMDVDVVYPSDRGLGNEGCPTTGANKLSDAVGVWGGDELDAEIEKLREE